MDPARRTQLLILLSILTAVCAGAAWSYCGAQQSNAAASERDWSICESELAALPDAKPRTQSASSQTTEDGAINGTLRAAAISSGLADQLASIDPGPPSHLRDTNVDQIPIYLRLNAVTLQQLIGFLYQLAATDRMLRTTDIELTPPVVAPASQNGASDAWTADITLSYLQATTSGPH